MNLKKLGTTTVVLTAIATAAPLAAQQHDTGGATGAPTTTSDIAGGAFAPTGTVAANASPAVTAAVGAAGVSVSTSLSSGTLTATSPTGQTIAIPAAVQAAVLSVLSGGAAPAGLTAAIDASGSPAAGELLQALDGLISAPGTGQLAEAIGFFNAVVGDASPAFLANPPAEFAAIHAVLTTMTGAAQAAG